MGTSSRNISLRTELLVNFAVLTAASIVFAVAAVVLLPEALAAGGGWFLMLVVGVDVAVIVAVGAFQLDRLVIAPVRNVVTAAEAIAGGDLARRVPAAGPRELHHLADSVNRMTDRLLREREQLVRAEKLASVGRLAAGVAHEIGNPLGAINGYTHLLREPVQGNARAVEALAGLERESARIDRIVRGLLDYSRPRTPAHVAIGVNDAVGVATELLRSQGALRGIDVCLELDETQPRFRGDAHEIEQVLVNLLLNAADAVKERARANANAPGRIAVRTERVPAHAVSAASVRRSVERGDQRLHAADARAEAWAARYSGRAAIKIVIADSGIGIAAENLERIFDPFFTTKEPGRGTGLGLAIVARIVENLQGAIWATTAREGGAAFHLLLPAES